MNADRRPHRLLWVLGVLSLLAMAVGARYLINSSPAESRDNEVTPPGILAPGLVDNSKGVRTLHPFQSGKVIWVIKEGERVSEGAVLLKLDNELQLFQYARAEADLKDAELLLEKAKIAERTYPLLVEQQKNALKIAGFTEKIAEQDYKTAEKTKAILKSDDDVNVRKAEANWEKAKAGVEAAKQKLQELEANQPALDVKRAEANRDGKKAQLGAAKYALDQCELKAEIEGQVLRVQTHVGEILGPNAKAPAIQFSPKAPLVVNAEVYQDWADRVHEGQEVIVENEPRSAGKSWRGRVRSVSNWFTHKRNIMLEPLMVNDVRTLECIIDLDGNPPLRIGQRVRVTFVETK